MWPRLLDALACINKETTPNNVISELRNEYCHIVHQADMTDDGEL